MESTINTRLIEVYENSGLTVRDFCEKAGISISTFYKVQNGEKISSRLISKISEEFSVSHEWIRKGTGSQERKEKVSEVEELEADYISHLKQEVKFYRHLLAQVTGMPAPNFKGGFANAVVKELYPPKQRKTVSAEAA